MKEKEREPPTDTIRIEDLEEYKDALIVKKIPMLTRNMMVKFLFLNKRGGGISFGHRDYDEVHYIYKGKAKLDTGKEEIPVEAGMMVTIAREKTYRYTVTGDRLAIIAFSPIRDISDER